MKRSLNKFEQVEQFFKIMIDDNDKVLQASEARSRNFLKNQHPGAVSHSNKRDPIEGDVSPTKRRRNNDDDIKAEDIPIYKKLYDCDKPIT